VRARTTLVLVALTVAVAAPGAGAATKSVRLESKSFAPGSITIHAGDGIRFRWISGLHNIRRVSGPSFSRIPSRDRGSVRRAFTKVGRYRLVCTLHRDLGMYLTVRVRR
jgi:plastocyanin